MEVMGSAIRVGMTTVKSGQPSSLSSAIRHDVLLWQTLVLLSEPIADFGPWPRALRGDGVGWLENWIQFGAGLCWREPRVNSEDFVLSFLWWLPRWHGFHSNGNKSLGLGMWRCRDVGLKSRRWQTASGADIQ
jgi:hypothetical protein